MARYGLGTRIRATLARILIPGPATDPHLRICGPGACLKAWTAGLFLDSNELLRTLFGLKFYLKKICSLARFEEGELREIWVKTRKIVGTAF